MLLSTGSCLRHFADPVLVKRRALSRSRFGNASIIALSLFMSRLFRLSTRSYLATCCTGHVPCFNLLTLCLFFTAEGGNAEGLSSHINCWVECVAAWSLSCKCREGISQLLLLLARATKNCDLQSVAARLQ